MGQLAEGGSVDSSYRSKGQRVCLELTVKNYVLLASALKPNALFMKPHFKANLDKSSISAFDINVAVCQKMVELSGQNTCRNLPKGT